MPASGILKSTNVEPTVSISQRFVLLLQAEYKVIRYRNLTNTTMRYTVSAPDVPMHAAIRLPASKSISNRALILHALAHGRQTLCNLSDCDDTRVMVRALQGNPEHIDIMAAGTAMRFLTAYLSVTPGVRIITGTQRMQQRPIRILTDALRQLGANIEYAGNEASRPCASPVRNCKAVKYHLPET